MRCISNISSFIGDMFIPALLEFLLSTNVFFSSISFLWQVDKNDMKKSTHVYMWLAKVRSKWLLGSLRMAVLFCVLFFGT